MTVWNGVPENDDKDDLHYIGDAVAMWFARDRKWLLLGRVRRVTPEWVADQLWATYRGPVPPPPGGSVDPTTKRSVE